MITYKINGHSVEANEEWTILETARHHGVHIPTLCFHESVTASGSCRLCIVEIKQGKWSKLVASCLYRVVSSDIEVFTDSIRVKNTRRWLIEMLLSEYPTSKKIAKIAKEHGVLDTYFSSRKKREKCFLCGLCVSVCKEISNINAISIVNRGIHKEIGAPFMKASKICVECGRCVTVCPTGAMSEKIEVIRERNNVRL